VAEEQRRRDDQARVAEEQKRRDDQARVAEEQRRRDDRARLAEEQKRLEEQARLAEEQKRRDDQAHFLAALEAQRQQEEQKQREEQTHIAALPPASTTPPGPLTQPQATKANLPEQIRDAQSELRRLGCFEGKLSGKMDTTTEKAIKAYWKHSNKPTVEINITDDFIADLQRHRDDFCTPSKPAVASHPAPPHRPAAPASPPRGEPVQQQAAPKPPQPPAASNNARATGIGF
jgi:hypothetical protein